jgi:hypothetical protein
MVKNEEIPESEPNLKYRVVKKYEQIKAHVRRNEKAYYIGTIVVVAGVTFLVTRRVYAPSSLFAKKIVIKDSVMIFSTYARQQGPPSWVVRCVENGEIFTSQADAAARMGLSASNLSSHLNGKYADVSGYHFERVAIATPRSV